MFKGWSELNHTERQQYGSVGLLMQRIATGEATHSEIQAGRQLTERLVAERVMPTSSLHHYDNIVEQSAGLNRLDSIITRAETILDHMKQAVIAKSDS